MSQQGLVQKKEGEKRDKEREDHVPQLQAESPRIWK